MIKKGYYNKKKKFYYLLLIIIFYYFIFFIQNKKINKESGNQHKTKSKKKENEGPINIVKTENINSSYNKKCYLPLSNSNLRIIHLIFTRFLINISYINYLLNLHNSFESKVLYNKDIKKYVRKVSKGFDVLITTSIDYDDRIYYDAVNDVRKAININKPMILYGYKRGVYYSEFDGNYYEFYEDYKNIGVMSIFYSLITVLNKVNDTYIIYNLGGHTLIRKTLLEKYKSYGIKELNYEPAIFDSGDAKFVYVRQNYSVTITLNQIKYMQKFPKLNYFNLSHFYGIY